MTEETRLEIAEWWAAQIHEHINGEAELLASTAVLRGEETYAVADLLLIEEQGNIPYRAVQ